MGIKIRFWAFILACILCIGVTYGLTVQRERNRIGSEDNYNQAMKYLEIKNTLDEYYVGTVDEEAVSSAAFAAMVEALGGFFGSSQLIIMQGTGTGYVCPMGEYHRAFRVDGTVTGTPRNNDDVRNGEMKINITYARRLGNAYISSAVPIEIKCKTADSDGEINKLLFMRGEFVLKLTDTEEYTALMIII